jgi:uncharacterized membrane protein YvbJ
MALKICPECSKQVSDDTVSCPNCGNQIASAGEDKAAGVPLAAIKQKSRKLQFQYIISILLLMAGGVWIFVLVSSEETVGKQDLIVPALMTVVGLIWAIVTKIRGLWQ